MKRPFDGPAPLDLFFGGPVPAVTPASPCRKQAARHAVYSPVNVGRDVVREPLYQRWHEVAAECPDHRSAADHCWTVVGKGWVHVRVGVGATRCVAAVQVRGEMRPVDGLAYGERTTDLQRLAELGGRY